MPGPKSPQGKRSPRHGVRDFDLWREVARTVKPLSPDRAAGLPSPPAGEVPERPEDGQRSGPSSAAMAVAMTASRTPAPAGPQADAAGGIDWRTARRLGRGQASIESRIDLHGETVETGRWKLLGFLRAASGRDERLVLAITGKGKSPFASHTLHGIDHFHAPEREGKLRRAFTRWMEEPAFRELVTGYQPAHPRHGGGGAFYLRLRRRGRPGNSP